LTGKRQFRIIVTPNVGWPAFAKLPAPGRGQKAMVLRTFWFASALAVSFTAAGDDLRVTQLEQEVRRLERQVQSLSRRLDELQRPRFDAAAPAPRADATAPATGDQWLEASRWRRVKAGMSELEVIELLGAPTSMRADGDARVLLYALEIGSSGFLGGSVRLRENAVLTVETPRLR
jgi:hypothetical protein